MVSALFDEAETARLRTALAAYTVDAVDGLLGPGGQRAARRGDLAGVARQLRGRPDTALRTLLQLFLLGAEVDEAQAARALQPLSLAAACRAGVLATSAGSTRALVDIRPYAQTGSPAADWRVVSDFGSDVRAGPLDADHVLGIGSATVTLAQAVPRTSIGRALDVGTGSGVQALHLGTHARAVVATDVSTRALRFAATTAALSGQRWELRHGSLTAPVAGEHFDLIVANPPFVISAGTSTTGGWTYRDSGLTGDAVSERLTRAIPRHLAPGGSAQLLANWIVPADGAWRERVSAWLDHSGCDAWVWQREVADPADYVSLWLRDAGLTPGTAEWTTRYDAWLDWFAASEVAAIGMGMISLWRSESADPVVVLEDVPQQLEQPVGPQLPAWIARQRWLAATDDRALLAAPLRAADGLVRERSDLLAPAGSAPVGSRSAEGKPAGRQAAAANLRQSHGLRWTVAVDEPIGALVAACDGATPLLAGVSVLAAVHDRPAEDVAAAVVPVVRDLVGRGFLIPTALDPTAPDQPS